ncbi:MAG: hypothetical protein ACK5QC_17435 [Bacteroidota bacterium]|jgi:hypothetical protein
MQNDELIPDFINDRLFNLFIEQLSKDFEMSGINIGFIDTLSSDYKQIVATIKSQLKQSSIEALLYRVDIGEAQLKNYCKINQLEFLDGASELIVKRILQKVIFRLKYK